MPVSAFARNALDAVILFLAPIRFYTFKKLCIALADVYREEVQHEGENQDIKESEVTDFGTPAISAGSVNPLTKGTSYHAVKVSSFSLIRSLPQKRNPVPSLLTTVPAPMPRPMPPTPWTPRFAI